MAGEFHSTISPLLGKRETWTGTRFAAVEVNRGENPAFFVPNPESIESLNPNTRGFLDYCYRSQISKP